MFLCDLAQAGHVDPVEADGVEQHDQPAPVDQPADRAREDRDRRQLDPVDLVSGGEDQRVRHAAHT